MKNAVTHAGHRVSQLARGHRSLVGPVVDRGHLGPVVLSSDGQIVDLNPGHPLTDPDSLTDNSEKASEDSREGGFDRHQPSQDDRANGLTRSNFAARPDRAWDEVAYGRSRYKSDRQGRSLPEDRGVAEGRLNDGVHRWVNAGRQRRCDQVGCQSMRNGVTWCSSAMWFHRIRQTWLQQFRTRAHANASPPIRTRLTDRGSSAAEEPRGRRHREPHSRLRRACPASPASGGGEEAESGSCERSVGGLTVPT